MSEQTLVQISDTPSTPTSTVPATLEQFQVTPRAARKVIQLAEKAGRAAVLRVGVRGGGCSGLSYFWDFDDAPRAHDLVRVIDGLTVICDPKSLKFLMGAELDYEDRNLLKAGFKFNNPNAKRSCSCGESFTL